MFAFFVPDNNIGVGTIPFLKSFQLPEPDIHAMPLDYNKGRWYSLAEEVRIHNQIIQMMEEAGAFNNEKDSCDR